MKTKLIRHYRSLSSRLQFYAIFLSLVGIGFGYRSYLHVKEEFGVEASAVFFTDLWTQIIVAIIVNAVIAILINNNAIKPLNTINEALRALSEDKLDIVIPFTDRGDQIGSTARKASIFQKNARELMALQQSQIDAEVKAREEKARTMNELAVAFDDNMSEVVIGVSGAASELEKTSSTLACTALSAKEEAQVLNNNAQRSLSEVNTVSTSIEELLQSINDMNEQIRHSTDIAKGAVSIGQNVETNFAGLVSSTKNIDNVLEFITAIAGQINLLALNATIEASRAGEAGKGFAVVASEVKSLADQANNAVSDITAHIASINQKTDNTQAALSQIIEATNKMDEIASKMTSSMQVQKHNADQIAASVEIAQDATDAVQLSAGKVSESSLSIEHSSQSVNELNGELHDLSVELKDKVAQFLGNLRHTE